jgi:hypothetical protein
VFMVEFRLSLCRKLPLTLRDSDFYLQINQV